MEQRDSHAARGTERASDRRATLHAYGAAGVAATWAYFDGTGASGGPANQFRLQQIKVTGATAALYQQFTYGAYDKSGNLLTLTEDNPAGYPFGDNSARDNDWTYAYDGLGRLTTATPQSSSWSTASFSYDSLGNLTAKGSLSFAPDATRPHRIRTSTPPGTAAANVYQYAANGGLTWRPDTDGTGSSNPDTARTIAYDGEGRVKLITSGSNTVESVYDYSGARVARVVNGVPTLYFGRLFELSGTVLTRHIYAGGQRIAQSTVTRTTALAAASFETRLSEIARAAGTSAAVLLLPLLLLIPGRLRISFAKGRGAPLRRLRRGHVLVLIVVFATVTCGPAMAQTTASTVSCFPPTPGSTPVPFPVYFVHTDHLGSTTLLTCEHQSNCTDGTAAAYFRYDAYGVMKAWTSSGASVSSGSELTDQLYTGQRWDAAVRTYDYGARVYDPRIARFLTEDPVREHMNPYAYVGWNPVTYTDPTGMFGEAAGSALAGVGAAINFVYGFPITQGWTSPMRDQIDAGFGPPGSEPGGRHHPPAWVPDWYIPLGLARALMKNGTGLSTVEAMKELGGLTAGSITDTLGGVAYGLWSEVGSARTDLGGGLARINGQTVTLTSAGATTGGYVDINLTAGYIVGGTGGVLFGESAYYIYGGVAATSPPGGLSVTASPSLASPGVNFGFQFINPYLISVQGGYALHGGFFGEVGIGGPAGLSATVFYVAGPFSYR